MGDVAKYRSFFLEHLGISSPNYFYYLNQSGTYKVDGTDDKKEFNDTMVCILFDVGTFHR